MRLTDKVAIITGGGSGFGEVTGHLFAREGAAVMLADIDGAAARTVAESITAEGGRGGVVINVSSVAGLVGLQNMSAYCAAKGAIIALTRAMGADFAPHGIRVNCIAPGTAMTPLGQRLIENDTPEKLAQRLSRYPLGRFAQPEEIARSVLFLASDDSSYATGMCLVMDGGLTCV